VKAWRSRDSFDEVKSSLKNWLFVIATNSLRDYFRKKKPDIIEIDENIAQESDMAAETEQSDLISYVFEKIKLLSQRDQELIALRYKSDLKIEEVAEIMGMEDSAVKVAIHRAIKKLQSLCDN
jgi:RNA polymerase sigma-70 factor (ECF subfamily)